MDTTKKTDLNNNGQSMQNANNQQPTTFKRELTPEQIRAIQLLKQNPLLARSIYTYFDRAYNMLSDLLDVACFSQQDIPTEELHNLRDILCCYQEEAMIWPSADEDMLDLSNEELTHQLINEVITDTDYDETRN